MNRLMLAVASTVSVLAFSASAATSTTWKKSGGVADGDWSDPNHWGKNGVPKAGYQAIFPASLTATVNFDCAAQTGYWELSDRAEGQPVTTFTWIGSGSLTNTATSLTSIGSSRKLVIDGPDIYVKKSFETTNATMEVKSGHFTVKESDALRQGARHVVTGGRYDTGDLKLYGDSRFEVAGGLAVITSLTRSNASHIFLSDGVLQMAAGTSLAQAKTNGQFTATGGTVRLTNSQISWVSTNLLPVAGQTVDVTYRGGTANAVYTETSGLTYSFDGTLYVTNRSVAGYPHQRYHAQKVHHTVAGKGTLFTDAMSIRGGYTMAIRIPRVFLGVGFDIEGSDGGVFTFPQGVTLGSWGDWSNDIGTTVSSDGGSVATMKFAGDVTFDTLDCFDRTTSHDVRLRKCTDSGMTSLTVSGGGTVDLAFTAAIAGLKTLVVEDNTTLYLTNMTGNVTAKSLRLGKNAQLHLKSSLSGCISVRAAEGAVFDAPNQASMSGLQNLELEDGAAFTVPNLGAQLLLRKLTMGKGATLNLPIGFGVEVRRLDCAADSKVVLSGEPTGTWLVPLWSAWDARGTPPTVEVSGYDLEKWELRNKEGILYLADETTKPTRYACGKQDWLGAVSGLWSETGNWRNGSRGSGSNYAAFDLDDHTIVTNDYASTIRYTITYLNAAPYFFRGTKTLTESYGGTKDTQNTIRHQGAFPAVYELPLKFTDPTPYLRSTGKSYLAVTNVDIGAQAQAPKHFYMSGDVRLGGSWCCTNMTTLASGSRSHEVTVYSNSTLTLTAAEASFKAFPKMTIDGLLDVSNTLTSVATANWLGEGAVKLHAVATDETAAFALREKLTLYPEAGWTTVAAETPDAAVTIAASDTPTLGATRDWTYGPAADAEPTTSAADRALTVGEEAVLTIDTEDPVTGEGHVVTFADPIVAVGKVVKTGAGTLVLASDANAIGELAVEEGAIMIPVVQTLDKVTFAAGATLALGDGQKAAAESEWTTVLTAKSVTGLGDTSGDGRYRLRTLTVDGLTVVQAKAKRGLSIILR